MYQYLPDSDSDMARNNHKQPIKEIMLYSNNIIFDSLPVCMHTYAIHHNSLIGFSRKVL